MYFICILKSWIHFIWFILIRIAMKSTIDLYDGIEPFDLNLNLENDTACFDIDSPTYNNIYLEKSDNSELLLAKNVPAGSRVMSP